MACSLASISRTTSRLMVWADARVTGAEDRAAVEDEDATHEDADEHRPDAYGWV